MKNKLKISLPCKISSSFILVGLYSVICQLLFTGLYISVICAMPREAFSLHMYAPFFESIILSLTLVFGGALLIDYAVMKGR